MSYTKDEIQAFEAKDLRINRVALLKSLIESKVLSLEELQNVDKVVSIVEPLVNYVYCGENKNKVEKDEVVKTEINWTEEAELMKVPVPTKENIKILLLIMEEYKKRKNGVEICPNHLLNTVYKKYHKYPTSKQSVVTVLNEALT